jgi:signal transduction histidine kinase/CheY-like chemotaxis protein
VRTDSIAKLVAETDFSKTPLGARETWPQCLRTALGICMQSQFPTVIWWGPEFRMLYNDAYVPLLGNKHPALGKRASDVWSEVWHVLEPMLRMAFERGEPSSAQDPPAFFTYSHSPISDEHGIGGVFTTVAETTARVLHAAATPSSFSHGHILVAEHDADMREYVARVLAEKWSVEIAIGGDNAVEIARTRRPDLIVSGIREPLADGEGLLQTLRADKELAAVPVLFLFDDADEDTEGQPDGDDYLAKPFSARELVARVGNLLELSAMRADAAIIQNIASQLTSELDLDRLLQLITDEATKLVGAEVGSFFYNVTDESGESRMQYTLSGVPRDAFAESPMPRNAGIIAHTFSGKGVVRSDDIKRDPRYGHNPPYHGMPKGHWPVTSYLAAPVISRTGDVLGGLFFGHTQRARFSDRHERMLVAVAAQGAVAIDNARLYERVNELLDRERDARAVAETASRVKDEFMAILGHELRNPLAPILTALQLMELRGDPQSRERQVIQRQVDHLVRLVDDLLDVSRITRGKLELARQRTELAPIVTQAIEMASPLIEQKQHRLHVSVPATGLEIDADPARMAQVLSNLLTNAAKYTPINGDVAIAAAREGGEIVVSVCDTGIGIAPDTLARIFEPFVQDPQSLDRSRGGLGLGLAIVKNLVEMHGGQVNAKSGGLNRGSEFVVRIPAIGTVAATDGHGESHDFAARPNAHTVLVVDDNVDAAQMVVESLHMLGHEAVATYDGPSALGVAPGMRPDIALLDIGLPVMDGYELARRLRDMPELEGVKLIAVTGYGQESDRQRSLAAGFDEHLVKPLRLEKLEEILAQPR